jgi:hypothetical protein
MKSLELWLSCHKGKTVEGKRQGLHRQRIFQSLGATIWVFASGVASSHRTLHASPAAGPVRQPDFSRTDLRQKEFSVFAPLRSQTVAAFCAAAISWALFGCERDHRDEGSQWDGSRSLDSGLDISPDHTGDTSDGAVDAGEQTSDMTGDVSDMPEIPPLERSYTPASTFNAPAGHTWVRSIVHIHSTHSHDACDGDPRPDGDYNVPCLHSLRQALCINRVDVTWLTDHPEHSTEIPFEDALLFLPGEGDTLVLEDGNPIGNWFVCADGHRVLIQAGVEDELMPLGLRRHVADTPAERDAILNARTPEAVTAMKDTGALIWQAHSEQRPLELLLATDLDGMEIYQLHANIDPDIREEALGLDGFAPLLDLAPFLIPGKTPVHPDLTFLLFLEDNRPSLDRWAAILLKRPMVGTAGTDAHENVFPGLGSDGERLDSYRRMISWFSNYILVDGPVTPQSTQSALGAGRAFIGFNPLGDVSGFDAWLEVDGVRHDMGATIDSGTDAAVLHIAVPSISDAGGDALITGRLLRATNDGWTTIGEDFPAGSHDIPLTEPGAYRVEIRTSIAHLAPYLGEYAAKIGGRDFPWIITNAWRWKLGL